MDQKITVLHIAEYTGGVERKIQLTLAAFYGERRAA